MVCCVSSTSCRCRSRISVNSKICSGSFTPSLLESLPPPPPTRTARVADYRPPRASDSCQNPSLEIFDLRLVAPIKCPLLSAFSPDQARLRQYLQVLAHCRLTDAELLSDQYAAHAIFDQITVDLRWEMLSWRAQPLPDLQAAPIRDRAQYTVIIHIDN